MEAKEINNNKVKWSYHNTLFNIYGDKIMSNADL